MAYYSNSDNRLVKIGYCAGNQYLGHQFYSKQLFFWGDAHKNQHCNLICKALCDGKENVRSCRYLEYDAQHNVVAEHILGSLTGDNDTPPKLDAKGKPIDNGCECYTKHSTYHDDPRHLKQSETLSNGLSTCWEYQSNTNLPTAKLTLVHGEIVGREFHAYDANATLIETITDDGASPSRTCLDGVSWRKITRITPKATTPCLGLPEIVAQFYIDPNTHLEHSLGYVINRYSIEGWMTSQEHHDAQGDLCYVLRWEYDTYGNPIVEQDALGQITQRRFDANSNKVYEQSSNRLFHTVYTYDLMNRLVTEEMNCDDGQRFSISHSYDVMGNRLSSTDALGRTTRYTYDELNRLVSTTIEGDAGPDAKPTQHRIQLEYDIAGNVTKQTDIDGTVTHTQYNIRNQPIRIDHPDSTYELFRYTLEGHLKRHRTRDGAVTDYSHDPLGNVVSKVIRGADGQQHCRETATFKGALLTSQTDANENTTHYQYDGAGRVIETTKPIGWSRYCYDSLGRVHQTIEWYGPDEQQVRNTFQEYDLLNRVIETRIEENRQLTSYNETGQIATVTTFTDQGPAITKTFYNAFGKIAKVIDPLGNETLTHYNYHHINSNNQQVLQITQIDAMGLTQVITHTALGHPCEIVHRDSFGKILRHAFQKHSPKGQLLERKDIIKTEGKDDREFVVEWIYDAVGRPVAMIEGKGSPQARQTYYSYNIYGQKELEAFHDSVSIRFTYDGLGRQSQLSASDGTVWYRFSYDANSNVTAVEDALTHTITTRCYDNGNRMVAETLGNGLTSTYTYDGIGRLI